MSNPLISNIHDFKRFIIITPCIFSEYKGIDQLQERSNHGNWKIVKCKAIVKINGTLNTRIEIGLQNL